MDRSQLLSLFVLAVALHACGGDSSTVSVDEVPASRNVVQGGSQDIGEFRRILNDDKVPPSSTLDEVGFFAEHAIDLPAAECGASVCAHPMLAVAPRFDGGNWTMSFIGMNTPKSPDDLEIGRRHLILVVENSPFTNRYNHLAEVLFSTVSESLNEEDRVSVVEVTEQGRVITIAQTPAELQAVSLEEQQLPHYWRPAEAAEKPLLVDLQRGLADARALALDEAFVDFRQRVLILTSGLPQGGATTELDMEALAHDLASHDVGVSTFGYGEVYRRRIPLATAEAGAGNAYVTTSLEDLGQALKAEAATGFVPLARDLTITVEAQSGYEVKAVYGARRARVTAGRAVLSSPVLFMGARSGSGSTEAGRRGGGGGWFVQLAATTEPGDSPSEEVPVLEVQVSYTDAFTADEVEQTTVLHSPLGVGNNPSPEEPFFSDAPRAKPFMMLNLWMAIQASVSYYEQGACPLSVGMRDMMEQSVLLWQRHYDDVDIDADFALLNQLADVIRSRCSYHRGAVWPVEAQVSCFYF